MTSTGKTLVSIAIIGALLAAGRIKRVLIVAPLSILGVWEDEFKRFADFPYQLIVLNGMIQKKIQQLRFLTGEGPCGGSQLRICMENGKGTGKLAS